MGRRRASKRTRRTAPSPSSSPIDSEPEGPDLIGALPDCVLHSILSLLPVKDAARTSVLSSRWTNLWKAAPLHLDDHSIIPECRRLTRAPTFDPWEWSRNAGSRILDSHHGPIETLHLSRFAGGCNVLTMGRIVESAVRRPGGIQQVSLDCYGSELPLSLLHCNSLHQLSLYRCTFPPNLPPSIFPNLIKLQLKFVHIYKDLVQNLLSQCRSLETLHISACYFRNNHTSISISSPSLRELDCYKTHFRELIIKDAPNLVSLMCDKYGSDSNGTYYKVKVLHAPKLEQLGFLENFQQALPLGRTRIERQAAPGLQIEASPRQMKMLSSIRTLAIKMTQKSYCDKTVPDLLAYFPCLESLDILVAT